MMKLQLHNFHSRPLLVMYLLLAVCISHTFAFDRAQCYNKVRGLLSSGSISPADNIFYQPDVVRISDTSKIILTLDGCRRECGAKRGLYSNVAVRLVTWLIPVLLLIGNIHIANLGPEKYRMMLHVLGDPINAMWSLLTKVEVWSRCYSVARQHIQQENNGEKVRDEGRILDVGIIYVAMQELDRPGTARFKTHFDNIMSQMHKDMSTEQFYLVCKDIANELYNGRSTGLLRAGMAVTYYLFLIITAFVGAVGEESSRSLRDEIFTAMFISWLIPAVLISNIISSFTSRNTCLRIMKLFVKAVTQTPVEDNLLFSEENASSLFHRKSRTYVYTTQQWNGAEFWYRPKTLFPGGPRDHSPWLLLCISVLPLLVATATSAIISLTPTGPTCQNFLIFLILEAWMSSAAITWVLWNSRLVNWLYPYIIMTKDALIGIPIVFAIVLPSAGIFNSCFCHSNVFSRRRDAHVILHNYDEQVRNAQMFLVAGNLGIQFLILAGMLYLSRHGPALSCRNKKRKLQDWLDTHVHHGLLGTSSAIHRRSGSRNWIPGSRTLPSASSLFRMSRAQSYPENEVSIQLQNTVSRPGLLHSSRESPRRSGSVPSVNTLAFSPDGIRLASGSWDTAPGGIESGIESGDIVSILNNRVPLIVEKMENSEHLFSETVSRYKIRSIVAELQECNWSGLTYTRSRMEDTSALDVWNLFKLWIDNISRERWVWWPFQDPKDVLLDGEARLTWVCTCGDERWAKVPELFASEVWEILVDYPELYYRHLRQTRPPKNTALRTTIPVALTIIIASVVVRLIVFPDVVALTILGLGLYISLATVCLLLLVISFKKTPIPAEAVAASKSREQGLKRSDRKRPLISHAFVSGPAVQASGQMGTQQSLQQQVQPGPNVQHTTSIQQSTISKQGADNQLNRDSYPATSSASSTGPMTPNCRYVFLIVASGKTYNLAQMCLKQFMTTNEFFQLLTSKYVAKRGCWRYFFSVWRYSHCDFYRFNKFEVRLYEPLKEDFPPPSRLEYEYAPRPIGHIPPIGPHEFYKRFHACYRQSWIHWHNSCFCPNTHNRERLALFPLRQLSIIEDSDQSEDFWGIYARERPSIVGMLTYNAVCIIPCLLFIFMWLFARDRSVDLQNASVPFTILVGGLSIFWSIFLSNFNFARRT